MTSGLAESWLEQRIAPVETTLNRVPAVFHGCVTSAHPRDCDETVVQQISTVCWLGLLPTHRFDVTTSTSFVLGYLLEESNDGKTWMKLKEPSATLTAIVKHSIDVAAFNAEAILRPKRVQPIKFPAPADSQSPIELTATASSDAGCELRRNRRSGSG